MMRKAILFDLDDTLIDTRERHFRVVQDFLNLYQRAFISFEEYVLTRLGSSRSNIEIVSEFYPELETPFKQYWLSNIETWKYLLFDKVIVRTDLLERLQLAGIAPIGISLRSNSETAGRQFVTFFFHSLFEKMVFLPHSKANPKIEYIGELESSYQILAFVGDSVTDQVASMANHIPFIGVKTGWSRLKDCPLFENINQYLNGVV